MTSNCVSGYEDESIHYAASRDDLTTVRRFVEEEEEEVDVDSSDAAGDPLLFKATKCFDHEASARVIRYQIAAMSLHPSRLRQ